MEEELRDCLHNYGFKEILAGEDDILDDRAELEEWSHDRLPRFDRDYLEDTIHEHLRRLSELTNGYVEDMGRPADVSDYCAHIRFMVEGYVGLSYGGYIETYRGNPNKIVVRFTVYLKQGEVDYLFRGTVEEVAEEINRGPAAGLYFENHLRISELRDWMKKYVKEE